MRALSAQDDAEKASELKLLDSDRVAPDVRASALYHLAVATGDEATFARCVEVAPDGKYAPYAKLRRAAALAASDDAAARDKGIALFVEIADSGSSEFAEEAVYLAANSCYGHRRHGEAASLFRRYLKSWPKGRHAADAARALRGFSA